jgi:hypothetical protein
MRFLFCGVLHLRSYHTFTYVHKISHLLCGVSSVFEMQVRYKIFLSHLACVFCASRHNDFTMDSIIVILFLSTQTLPYHLTQRNSLVVLVFLMKCSMESGKAKYLFPQLFLVMILIVTEVGICTIPLSV